jgi:flagellar biogenesis protein FliO
MSILISFINLLLYLAIIIFVAYCIVWLIRGFKRHSVVSGGRKLHRQYVGSARRFTGSCDEGD